jgi:hypothetical protein
VSQSIESGPARHVGRTVATILATVAMLMAASAEPQTPPAAPANRYVICFANGCVSGYEAWTDQEESAAQRMQDELQRRAEEARKKWEQREGTRP